MLAIASALVCSVKFVNSFVRRQHLFHIAATQFTWIRIFYHIPQRFIIAVVSVTVSAGAVQAGGDGPPLSGTASPVVPRRLLRAGLHGSWSPAYAVDGRYV